MKNNLKFNVHPGRILKELYLDELKISAYRLSKETGIPESLLSNIVNCKKDITAKTSIILGKFFNLHDEFFLKLQNSFNIRKEKSKLKDKLKKIKNYKELGIAI
jgi:addiction module HigA family antidote